MRNKKDQAFGEFDLIEQMTRSVRIFSKNLRTGIGDDSAVISGPEAYDLLLTSDLIIEKVHFDRRWFLPEQIGGKAFLGSLSDIAAMGGLPEFALVSLAVPVSVAGREAEALYQGIRKAAEQFEVTLAGGDLSRSDGGIFIDIMHLGRVEKDRAVLRSGARPGDRIFVSGTLGESALGLHALQSDRKVDGADLFIRRQRLPEPRIGLGRILGTERLASAMIDLSDGLSSDLGHLCKSSGVGARVRLRDLPVSKTYQKVCMALSVEPMSNLLHGGEDYELLFTVRPGDLMRLSQASLPVPVVEVGEILPASEGLSVEFPDGGYGELSSGGYDHFRIQDRI